MLGALRHQFLGLRGLTLSRINLVSISSVICDSEPGDPGAQTRAAAPHLPMPSHQTLQPQDWAASAPGGTRAAARPPVPPHVQRAHVPPWPPRACAHRFRLQRPPPLQDAFHRLAWPLQPCSARRQSRCSRSAGVPAPTRLSRLLLRVRRGVRCACAFECKEAKTSSSRLSIRQQGRCGKRLLHADSTVPWIFCSIYLVTNALRCSTLLKCDLSLGQMTIS